MSHRYTSGAVFDADQHYYEPPDAFTRYLPTKWADRTVSLRETNGRLKIYVAGELNTAIKNPLFDPISKPGALMRFFRGNPEEKDAAEYLSDSEPLPDYYRSPRARLSKMDSQGIERTWLLPTVGMTIEELLQCDPEAAAVAFHAFNEWLYEDWGFVNEGRIFTAPYLAMGDIDRTTKEIDWALDRGARLFVVRPSGVCTRDGWFSPGDPRFDPIWGRINDAGVTVVSHIGDVGSHGLDRYAGYHRGVFAGPEPPLQIVVGHSRPITNYLSALVCDRLFERFPNLRIASVENGSECLSTIIPGLRRAGQQRPGYFKSDPVDQFRSHVWVTPFWEDDILEAVDAIGPDRVLFGSDWPHVEGLAEPSEYDEIAKVGYDAGRKIMHDNTAELTTPVA